MLENGNGGLTMESIVEKLAEIEKTAESIVEHAQARKTEVEREIQAKRDDFDRELDAYTKIRTQAEAQMDQVLEEQRIQNRSEIERLNAEYEKNHTRYAREILKKITEE